jgi:hypothetical protein
VVRERLENAFYVAEKEYGVTRLLDPEGESEKLIVFCCSNVRIANSNRGRGTALMACSRSETNF